MPCLQVIGEFDDSTMIKAFAHSGAWLLCALAAISDTIYAQYGVMMVGNIPSLREQGREPGRVVYQPSGGTPRCGRCQRYAERKMTGFCICKTQPVPIRETLRLT